MYLFESVYSFSSDTYPAVELLDHMVVLFLGFFFFFLKLFFYSYIICLFIYLAVLGLCLV